jgi:hypothetical protein
VGWPGYTLHSAAWHQRRGYMEDPIFANTWRRGRNRTHAIELSLAMVRSFCKRRPNDPAHWNSLTYQVESMSSEISIIHNHLNPFLLGSGLKDQELFIPIFAWFGYEWYRSIGYLLGCTIYLPRRLLQVELGNSHGSIKDEYHVGFCWYLPRREKRSNDFVQGGVIRWYWCFVVSWELMISDTGRCEGYGECLCRF